MAKIIVKTTINEVEYEALIAGLSIVKALGTTKVEVNADSQVVVNQEVGTYAAKGEKFKKYLNRVWESRDRFSYFNITQIPKGSNSIADRLAKAASRLHDFILPWEVEKRVIKVSVVEGEVNGVELKKPNWARKVEKYLDTSELPVDKEEGGKLGGERHRSLRWMGSSTSGALSPH